MNDWELAGFWYRAWLMHQENRDVIGMRQSQLRYLCHLAQEWAGARK